MDEDDALFDGVATLVIPGLLYLAAKLRLADLVHERPATLGELVERTGTDADALARVLRALCSLGMFGRTRGGEYRLERAGEPLLTDHPRSRRATLLFMGELQRGAWTGALHAVQTGESGFEQVFGQGMAEYLAGHDEAMAVVEAHRRRRNESRNRAIVEALPLTGVGTIADVGGGGGELLALLLQRSPSLRGVLIELPSVAARASARLEALGVADRVEVVCADSARAGEVAAAVDIAIVVEVVHCMPDADARALLERCPGRRVYVIERILPPANQASAGHFADLHMLVTFGGRERTRKQFARLLDEAGLRMGRVLTTQSWVRVIESTRRSDSRRSSSRR